MDMKNQVSKRVMIMSAACKILEGYKDVVVPFGCIDISENDSYLIIKPKNMKERNMPFAAKKILKKFPKVEIVHFTGGWTEHVYTRNTLKWMGIKIAE